MTLEEVLAHHGIKGMHWGVRRNRKGSADTSSADAKRASESKSVVKKGGTKSLSNKELQDLVTRMNLEQQFHRLQPPTKKQQAAKFIADTLLQVGKQQAAKLLSDLAAKQVAELLKKTAKEAVKG